MAGLVAAHGPVRLGRPERAGDRFESLANAIVFQQLHGAAARTIWGRVRGLVDGPFTPAGVLAQSEEALRGAGLSGNKLASLRDLAWKVDTGEVQLERIGRLADHEIVDHLTAVRGIGPWTAQMFLMFNLRRLDVWPTGDYGVRAGYARAFELPAMPSAKELEPLGDALRPYRSLAAWYCWRVADTITPVR
jgi:3-methyladenine DNA glycosylase/8-oxoguanine DNA glycosylase